MWSIGREKKAIQSLAWVPRTFSKSFLNKEDAYWQVIVVDWSDKIEVSSMWILTPCSLLDLLQISTVKTYKVLDKYKGSLLFFWLSFKLTSAWSSRNLTHLNLGSDLMLKTMRVLDLDYLALGSTSCGTFGQLSWLLRSWECVSSAKWRHNQLWLKEIMHQMCMAQVLACDIYSIVTNPLLACLRIWGFHKKGNVNPYLETSWRLVLWTG